MAGEINIHVVGNLADDPELRFTSGGVAVAKMRIASTPRVFKDGAYADGDTSWVAVTVWRTLAEHCAASLKRGMRVIAVGKFAARTYQTAEGENRTVWEMTADAVGPDLTWATVEVTRTGKNSAPRAPSEDPWATSTPERPQQPAQQTQQAQRPAPATADAQRTAAMAGAEPPPW